MGHLGLSGIIATIVLIALVIVLVVSIRHGYRMKP